MSAQDIIMLPTSKRWDKERSTLTQYSSGKEKSKEKHRDYRAMYEQIVHQLNIQSSHSIPSEISSSY